MSITITRKCDYCGEKTVFDQDVSFTFGSVKPFGSFTLGHSIPRFEFKGEMCSPCINKTVSELKEKYPNMRYKCNDQT